MSVEPTLEAPEERPAGAWRHGRLWATAALLFACAHFASFEVLTRPVTTDIRYFLYFAWRVTEGETPHLDLFDPKTQLATFAGALLFRIGSWLGVEELYAVRYGYLGIAALGGWLAFFVHRRLGRSSVAGMLGVLAYCSFGLLGDLPAYGNVPKLLMAVFATVAGLCAYHRRWFWAGVAGAFAFLDWQIGVVAWLGAFLTAALFARRRGRATLHVALGGAAGMAPFALYFWIRGALAEAFQQTVVSAFFRGAVGAEAWSLAKQLRRMRVVAEGKSVVEPVLVGIALAGVVLSVLWLWRRRRSDDARLLGPICVSHYGILAFSLLDFQARGDAFILLHSVAFFLALVWTQLHGWAIRLVPPGRAALVSTAVLVAAFAAARPAQLSPKQRIPRTGYKLADQVEVANQLEEAVEGKTLAVIERSELLFLLRRDNPLPFIYWNAASWGHYRESDSETAPAALRRLFAAAPLDAVIISSFPFESPRAHYAFKTPGPEWRPRRFESENRRCGLLLHER